MNTAKKVCLADNEGIVHVRLLSGKPGQRVEVVVVWEESAGEATVSPDDDWSDLFGLLRDAPLERSPQGQLEERDELG